MGATGSTGPLGEQGAQGAPGGTGPAGTTLLADVTNPYIWDDFVSGSLETQGAIGSLGWTTNGGRLRPGEIHHPGIFNLESFVDASTLQLSQNSAFGVLTYTNAVEIEMVVRINGTLSDGDNFRIGLMDFSDLANGYGVYFQKDGTGKWEYTIKYPSTILSHGQDVLVDDNWVKLKFQFTLVGSDISLEAALTKQGVETGYGLFTLEQTFLAGSNLGVYALSPSGTFTIDIDYVSIRWPNLQR
jgi:hypothetical protein